MNDDASLAGTIIASTATIRAGNDITPDNNSASVTIDVSLRRIE